MQKIVAFALFSTRRQEEITLLRWDDLDRDGILVRDMKHPGDKKGNDVWCEVPPEALARSSKQWNVPRQRYSPTPRPTRSAQHLLELAAFWESKICVSMTFGTREFPGYSKSGERSRKWRLFPAIVVGPVSSGTRTLDKAKTNTRAGLGYASLSSQRDGARHPPFPVRSAGAFSLRLYKRLSRCSQVLKRRPERLSVTGAGFSDMAAGDARLDGSLSTFTIPSMWNEGMPARFNPFFISALAAASVLLAYPLLRYFWGDRDAQLKDWEPVQKLRRRSAH